MVMKYRDDDTAPTAMETQSRTLFLSSVESLDMPMRSRLTQARHAALEAASAGGWRWRVPLPRMRVWTPAVGVAAAALLGIALWNPGSSSDAQANLEDLDIVASSDAGTGDAMEMLQDDIDFYDFAEKASTSEPAA